MTRQPDVVMNERLDARTAQPLTPLAAQRSHGAAALMITAAIVALAACSSSGSASSSGSGAGSGGATSAGSTGASSTGDTGASSTTGMSSSTGGGPTSDVHLIGRFDHADPAGPRFAWPGSAIVARFSGTGLTVHLNDSGSNFFAVVVDQGAPTTLATKTGQTDYVIAQGLADDEHDVWIEKRTESFAGVVQFLGFTTASGGPLIPTPEPFARRIELIGDSITCGYGNEGQGPNCSFSADTENEYLAYGAVAARALGAEHFGISYSGIGVYRNYDGGTADIMPQRYERTFADDPSSAWDFSTPPPDVVVINLGTNDFAQGDPGQPYVDAYTAFAAQVRGHYPSAFILLAIGPLLGEPEHTAALGYADQVIAARAKAGDTQMSRVDLGIQDAADGLGCDYHPSVKTDQKMADTLVTAIKKATGW